MTLVSRRGFLARCSSVAACVLAVPGLRLPIRETTPEDPHVIADRFIEDVNLDAFMKEVSRHEHVHVTNCHFRVSDSICFPKLTVGRTLFVSDCDFDLNGVACVDLSGGYTGLVGSSFKRVV